MLSFVPPSAYLLEMETVTDYIAEQICNIFCEDYGSVTIDEAADIYFNWNTEHYRKVKELGAFDVLEQKIRELIKRR